jgi:hypothetical protein
LLLGAAVFALLSTVSSSRGAGRLAWPRAADAPPAGWVSATTASRSATLFYPAGWKPISGDRGTVSVARRDSLGRYLAYLNVTPRQGAERLRGWAAFRTTRNRGEGDHGVREVAAAENLRFFQARGSCVIDDYRSRVGANPYRELACIVAGRGHTDVFVGATLRREWNRLSPTVLGAASALTER